MKLAKLILESLEKYRKTFNDGVKYEFVPPIIGLGELKAEVSGDTPPQPSGGGASPPPQDYDDIISRLKADIDHYRDMIARADAELRSLMARTDISQQEKARIAADIISRIKGYREFIAHAQKELAKRGRRYAGGPVKDYSDWDPYKQTDTDKELGKIAEAQDEFDKLIDVIGGGGAASAGGGSDDKAGGTGGKPGTDIPDEQREAALRELRELVRQMGESGSDYGELARKIHDLRVKTHMSALEQARQDAWREAEKWDQRLKTAEKVYAGSKTALAVLALGAAGGGLVATLRGTGAGAELLGLAARGTKVMIVFDGTTGAVEGYSENGVNGAVKKGAVAVGQYVLPINTYLAYKRGDGKLAIALSVLADAANVHSSYKALQAMKQKLAAAKVRIARASLAAPERAVAEAADQARRRGKRLVLEFQEAVGAMKKPGHVVSMDEINKLDRIVKLIDADDEAKLLLKKSGSYLQREFVTHQEAFVKKPVRETWREIMRGRGWSTEAVEIESIRNKSSAGTVGMDDDLRLIEPTLKDKDALGRLKYSGLKDPKYIADREAFARTLTKNGSRTSLAEWQKDAQQAMDEAYRRVTGHGAEASRVNMTTTEHVEAYKDILLLEGNPAQTKWAEQTASVARVKVTEGVETARRIGLGEQARSISGLSAQELGQAATEIKVATRELLKDLVGKALRARPGTKLPGRIRRQIEILTALVNDPVMDPATANWLLKKETGASLAKVMESLPGHYESILKFGR